MALVAALTLSVLYFALLTLLLADSNRELAAARRFKARVVAAAMAENAAELAAEGIVTRPQNPVNEETEDARLVASIERAWDGRFEIKASASTTGVTGQSAWVRVYGRVQGTAIRIDYTMHSQ